MYDKMPADKRTFSITREWLLQSGLSGNELLLEALLRRGFLALQEEDRIWLGTGSHIYDIAVLKLVDGLDVQEIVDHRDRAACIKFKPDSNNADIKTAIAIIALPENHFDGRKGWTGADQGFGWMEYREMTLKWGMKMAACPASSLEYPYRRYVSNALDIGIALLVKTFPLIHVTTSFSCDGHGKDGMVIGLCFCWDSWWGKCVADVLGFTPVNSKWHWYEDTGGLYISPRDQFSDGEILDMLNDIQRFARLMMNNDTIKKISRAHSKTLKHFPRKHMGPPFHLFEPEARRQLAKEFGSVAPIANLAANV
ncbi:MAG: hypothetical protein IPO13_02640 [Rhodocyclaceae bacterium]|nr:hypothetical protein [Rhodocyclaceae bacterium]